MGLDDIYVYVNFNMIFSMIKAFMKMVYLLLHF